MYCEFTPDQANKQIESTDKPSCTNKYWLGGAGSILPQPMEWLDQFCPSQWNGWISSAAANEMTWISSAPVNAMAGSVLPQPMK